MSENIRLATELQDFLSDKASKQNRLQGIINLAPLSGGQLGFIKVDKEGLIVSYGSPTGTPPGSHTIVLAAITGLGTQGSITWDNNGLIRSWVDPT
jgi:hypothetical protein